MKSGFAIRFFAIVLLFGFGGCDWVDKVLKDTSPPLVRLAYIRVEDPQLIRISLTEGVSGSVSSEDFSVEVNSSPAGIVSAETLSADPAKILIRISAGVSESDSVSFSYQPVSGALADSAGNALASFSDKTVENYTATENFYAANIETGGYDLVAADLVYQGTNCLIFRQQGEESRLSDSAAEAIGIEFDTAIYTPILNAFGDPSDVDGNGGKIVLLVMDIQDGFTGSGGYVAGFFNPNDTYSKTSYTYSNERDMLYMDSYPGLEGSDTSTFRETMAHELQHLINHNEKVFLQGGNGFDLWINEGMSSAAEKIYAGGQILDKIAGYNSGIGSIESGTNFISWSGDLDSYATVYLFFQWLSIHSDEGDSIFGRIMDDTAEDYTAVQNAAVATFTGAPGSFGELLGAWFLANELNAPSGLHGYKGLIATNPPRYSGSSVVLQPGEGVYMAMSGGSIAGSSSSNIVIYGVNTSNGSIDQTAPYDGDVLIAYNRSGTPSRTGVTVGDLPASLLSADRSLRTQYLMPKRYRVDVQFGEDGMPHLSAGERQ